MGKQTICTGENKDADQLHGNREADQRLCFRYSNCTNSLLALFCACTGRFRTRHCGSQIIIANTHPIKNVKLLENKSNLKHLVRAAPVTERSLSLDYLTAVPGVGSSPALLAGVPCGFSRGSFVFAHLLIGPYHMR